MHEEILRKIREAAEKRVLFLPHAVRQMARSDRMISNCEVENVVRMGNVIEDCPDNSRGHSCLVLGFGVEDRPIHVVCSPKNEYLAIITAYIPDERRWTRDYRMRS